MRIDLVNIRYPKHGQEYVATYIEEVGKRLAELGHDVNPITGGRNWTSGIGKGIDMLLFNVELFRKLDGNGADMLFVNHPPYLYYPLRKHTKNYTSAVFNWHGGDLLKRSNFWSGLRRHFLKSYLMEYPQVVPSEYFKKELLSRSDVSEENIHVIPTGGINDELFSPFPTDRNDIVRLGFGSGVTTPKGDFMLDHLISNADEIESLTGKQIKFKVIAYGDNLSRFGPKWKRDPRVEFLDPFGKPEMPEFYGQIDVMLFLTSGEFESLGLMPIEAMCCGRPVLGPDIFAVPEFVIPGMTGELYKPHDRESLLDTCVKLIDRLDSYDPGPITIDKYSIKKVLSLYSDLIQPPVTV